MCRKGTFRGTVFFIAEGHGEIVLDIHDESSRFPRDQGGGGDGSSTESLLAAAAFGNRRAHNSKRKRRRRGDENGGGSNGEKPGHDHNPSVGYAEAGAATAVGPGPVELAADNHAGLAAAGRHPAGLVLHDSHENLRGQPSRVSSPSSILFADGERQDWAGGGEERCPMLAALKRGDFFGVDPASPTATAFSERVSVAGNETITFPQWIPVNPGGAQQSTSEVKKIYTLFFGSWFQ